MFFGLLDFSLAGEGDAQIVMQILLLGRQRHRLSILLLGGREMALIEQLIALRNEYLDPLLSILRQRLNTGARGRFAANDGVRAAQRDLFNWRRLRRSISIAAKRENHRPQNNADESEDHQWRPLFRTPTHLKTLTLFGRVPPQVFSSLNLLSDHGLCGSRLRKTQ